MIMYFLYNWHGSMQANWLIHEEKWMSIANDGMGKMVSLYFILSYVLFA